MVNRKLGQQEVVGFVLIVVLVVVGLMIFLVISLRSSSEEIESVGIGNMLDAVMRYTTDCAIIYEPNYDNFEELLKSCYQGKQCKNLGVSACDYLNESLRSVVSDLMLSEASVDFYEIGFFDEDGEILKISDGKCDGNLFGAQRKIFIKPSESLIIRLRVCVNA